MKPTFSEEQKLWREGYGYVVGIDEVGRGSFAGPVVTAAVVWPQTKLKVIEKAGINDSKQLKPRQREELAKFIRQNALVWDVTEVGVSVINRIGIGKATEKAMRKAVGDVVRLLGSYIVRLEKKKTKKQYSNLAIQQSSNLFVLVDGFHVRYLRELGLKNQKAIVKGDQKSISIASASILAKVYRDKIMESLSKQSKYKKYAWGRNKGYGTSEHQKAILRYGLTRYHRKDFVKTFLEKKKEK